MVGPGLETGLRSAVVVNSKAAEPVVVTVHRWADSKADRAILWQPCQRAKEVDLPVTLKIPGSQLAILTEEPALDRLAKARTDVPRGR